MEDEQDVNDGFNEDEGTGTDAGSGAESDAPPATGKGTKDSGNSDTRINDLMSKWQSEQSRANALEARLAALEGSGSGNGGNEGSAPAGDDLKEERELIRTAARQSLYASEPRLAQLGIEPDAIEGTTAAEMQASFKKLTGLLDKVEGSTRTKLVKELGLDPEIGTGGSEKPRDFASMSDKEILELGDRALGRL